MDVSIVNTGIDTIKVNVKLVDENGNIRETQVLPNELATMVDVWQEQARQYTRCHITQLSRCAACYVTQRGASMEVHSQE